MCGRWTSTLFLIRLGFTVIRPAPVNAECAHTVGFMVHRCEIMPPLVLDISTVRIESSLLEPQRKCIKISVVYLKSVTVLCRAHVPTAPTVLTR